MPRGQSPGPGRNGRPRRPLDELERRSARLAAGASLGGTCPGDCPRDMARMGGMDRVLQRLDELYAIGATRIGYTAEEDAAHELCAGWLREAGLVVETDSAGNTF